MKGGQIGLLPNFNFLSQPGPSCRGRVVQQRSPARATIHATGVVRVATHAIGTQCA